MIERKAYICEYCDKHKPIKKHAYLSKEKADKHERICFYNPKLRTCFTCKHNDYSYKGNICKINQNENYLYEVRYCADHGFNIEEGYPIMPKSMQIMRNCKHWAYAHKIDESEGE
jgi:hypothetical protein